MLDDGISRRAFLTAAAVAAATGRVSPSWGQAMGDKSGVVLVPDVVQITSDYVVRGRVVHKMVLSEMIDAALQRITGESSSPGAWKKILRSDDVIGLKFNRSGSAGLGVTEPFADAVLDSLLAAGFTREQIVPIEIPANLYKSREISTPVRGWDARPTDFGSGRDQLCTFLDQVTAIVNIPFLKTHNIAGITCCLKNLSHGLIKHPARYHGSHCSPYIADIVALPQIREKLRLNLVNALRVVFDGGPSARDDSTWDAGIILASRDPVAADTLGMDIINSQRNLLGLESVDSRGAKSVHLAAAAKRGLGTNDLYRMEVARVRI